MTKTQLRQKVNEIARYIKRDTIKEVDKLIASGAISLLDYENNYELPKILITAALERRISDYDQQTPRSVREVANLVRM